MRIRYITGRAGSGKSRLIFDEIKQHLDQGDTYQLILLVPEQFTLQSERDLIQSLNLPGIMQVEVLSFDRLAMRILAEAGGQTRIMVDEQGRQMVLRRVIDQLMPELTVYQKVSRQDGFIGYIGELLSEFKQYQISWENIAGVKSSLEEPVASKVGDVALIYQHFMEYLGNRYLDVDDRMNLVLERISQATFLQNSIIWLDGFTTFTPQHLAIIEKLMLLSRQITFAFTIDPDSKGRDYELFTPSRRAYDAVRRLTRDLCLPEEHVDLYSDDQHFSALAHLEKEIYAFPNRVYTGEISNISLFSASTVYSEVEQAASEIVRLAREEQLRWREIVVVCSDTERYGYLIARTFQEYGIPFFIDSKRDIITHPLIEYILSLLDLQLKNYRFADVFRHLKTGMTDLDPDQVEILENYALAYGIQGEQWKRDFILGQDEPLDELNQWREQMTAPLIKFEQQIRQARTIEEYSSMLYEHLQEQRLSERLKNWIQELKSQGCYEQVYENTQIWNIIMRILDQTVDIMGDQAAALADYHRILQEGFASYKLGLIPTTVDQVLVGSIDHLKSRGIKALLVLGANDGLIPSIPSSEGILLEEDRRALNELGIAVPGGRETRLEEERFQIYSMFSKASEHVWLSYTLADGEGRALRPSLLVDRFKRLFKELPVQSDVIIDREQQMKMVSTPLSTFKHLTGHIREYLEGEPLQDFWWQTVRWYQMSPDWADAIHRTRSALFHRNQVANISAAHIESIYSRPLRTSVSRLEQFAACPFAHLVRYGLRPRERKEYSVAFPDIGELFHQCLYTFSQQVSDADLEWGNIKHEECDQMVEQIMEGLVQEYGEGVFQSTHRYRYMVERLKRMGKTTVKTVVDHIQKGEFQPLAYEVRFGAGGEFPPINVKLPDGDIILLEGRVDRVDVFDDGDNSYIKIIDYKTGAKNLRLDEVYYGLSLQLMVYLQAILNNSTVLGRRCLLPAGALYFHIDDPVIQTDEMIKDKVEQELRRWFRMKGLILKDVRIIQSMDRDIHGYSEVIPAAVNNDGSVRGSASALEADEWLALLSHVESTLSRLGEDILQGKAAIEPFRRQQENACTYCPYRSICQFDPRFEENQYRYMPNLGNEEVLTRIRSKGVE